MAYIKETTPDGLTITNIREKLKRHGAPVYTRTSKFNLQPVGNWDKIQS